MLNLQNIGAACYHRCGRAFSGVIDLVYPRLCAVCGAEVGEGLYSLCGDCLGSVPLLCDPVCEVCGLPVVSGQRGGPLRCGSCLRRLPPYDKARSAVAYGGAVKEAITMMKFRHGFWVARDLSLLLAGCAKRHFDLSAVDGVIPVPLHARRRRERTANQSELLAHALGRKIGLPVVSHAVIRSRETRRQTDLGRSERLRNLRGAFEVVQPSRVDQRSLLIVDDVMTTGTTAAEVAGTLKRAGATDVWFLSVARGSQSVRMDEQAEREGRE